MPHLNSLVRCTCMALSLLSLNAYSQHESRWYKVELMVFSHRGSAVSEQFEPTPELGYPKHHRFLLHPQQLRAAAARHEGAVELDSFGRLTLLPPVTEPDEPDIPLLEETLTDVAAEADESLAEEEAGPRRPTPFVALPASQREFRGKAAYMQNTGEYRILFHEAWAQPVMGINAAVPLVLDRSGDTQDWPELQGSIKLHVARYLHLETRIWLNTRGDYLPPGNWRMPAAPLGPPSVIIVEPPAEEELAFIEPEVSLYDSDSEDGALGGDAFLEEEPASPWRHAVLLDQKRRMRSLEVHYIDHPLLSVVIKLEPLSEEQLQAMAAAEQPILPPATMP